MASHSIRLICFSIQSQCDQAKQGIVNTPSKMDDYVKEHGFAGWFETSAKEDVNIEEAARALVNKVTTNPQQSDSGFLFTFLIADPVKR